MLLLWQFYMGAVNVCKTFSQVSLWSMNVLVLIMCCTESLCGVHIVV